MARPSTYSPELAAEICESLANGLSLRKILDKASMPTMSTVMLWLTQHQEFSEQYRVAREAQAETLADQIVDLVDEEDDPARARVRMDARKWYASKLQPKKYGDKIAQEVSGPNAGPVTFQIVSGVPRADD